MIAGKLHIIIDDSILSKLSQIATCTSEEEKLNMWVSWIVPKDSELGPELLHPIKEFHQLFSDSAEATSFIKVKNRWFHEAASTYVMFVTSRSLNFHWEGTKKNVSLWISEICE